MVNELFLISVAFFLNDSLREKRRMKRKKKKNEKKRGRRGYRKKDEKTQIVSHNNRSRIMNEVTDDASDEVLLFFSFFFYYFYPPPPTPFLFLKTTERHTFGYAQKDHEFIFEVQNKRTTVFNGPLVSLPNLSISCLLRDRALLCIFIRTELFEGGVHLSM